MNNRSYRTGTTVIIILELIELIGPVLLVEQIQQQQQ